MPIKKNVKALRNAMAAEKGRNVSIQLMYESIARECQLKKNPSVNRRCSALEVSRSGYYDWLSRKDLPTPALEIQLRDEIQKIVLEFTGYGYRRVTKELLRRGFSVGHKRLHSSLGYLPPQEFEQQLEHPIGCQK